MSRIMPLLSYLAISNFNSSIICTHFSSANIFHYHLRQISHHCKLPYHHTPYSSRSKGGGTTNKWWCIAAVTVHDPAIASLPMPGCNPQLIRDNSADIHRQIPFTLRDLRRANSLGIPIMKFSKYEMLFHPFKISVNKAKNIGHKTYVGRKS